MLDEQLRRIETFPFTRSYLESLVDRIEEDYLRAGKDLSRLALVFGGKRPALFLKKELARRFRGPFTPPAIFTIDEFVSTIIREKEPYRPAVDLDHCYLLYGLARSKAPQILKHHATFAQFLPWSREILKFIDHLDLEMTADDRLLNVKENASIGYPVPDDINLLLKHVLALKQAFHVRCRKERVYSRGLAYLRAAELIGQCGFPQFDEVYFCNFFYFHKTEETIVKSLYERGKAVLLFQGDQRKWDVLDHISRKFACRIEEGEQPIPTTFVLNFYRAFDTHSQVAQVRQILKSINDKERTVIVLPDPDTLVPLISEIAGDIKEFNISMGYPLKRSSFYTLFEFLFRAQLSVREGRYYARDYLRVLRHPFVKNLELQGDRTVTRILVHKIEEVLKGKEKTPISGNLYVRLDDIESCDELMDLTQSLLGRLHVRVSRDDIQKVLKDIHRLTFRLWEDLRTFNDFSGTIKQFLDVFVRKSFLKDYPLNLNIAEKMYGLQEELAQATFKDEGFTREEMFRIFDEKISREIVSFKGSPLKGLQILGLFETRSLNFDNVIVLDTNEGVLPHLNIYEPLIPRDVMISLNLDRLELEEEIQRYQFMRLISSAENVHIIYQETKDKEKSRFVEELMWSEQKRRGEMEGIDVHDARFHVQIAPKEIAVRKTPEMIRILQNHTYSASSINTYLRSPLEFYEKYVLGLREQEDLLDEPEARHIGTFLHELLEEAFTPFVGKAPKITSAFKKSFAKRFDKKFEDTFERQMRSDSFLLKRVLAERLERFLQVEGSPERGVQKILFLEKAFDDVIDLSCGKIKFKYIVDRVDILKDGTVMIIDYKTGSVDLMPKSLEAIRGMDDSREAIQDNIRSFQIPLYFHYLNKEFPDQPINAALYSLRTMSLKPFICGKTLPPREEIDRVFMKALDATLCEILDPEVPFTDNYL